MTKTPLSNAPHFLDANETSTVSTHSSLNSEGTGNSRTTGASQPRGSLEDQLIEKLTPFLQPLGYEVVHLETQLARQKILRLFIDFEDASRGTIGIEDCTRVSRTLDEPLDLMPEIESIFKGPYELEVSSPGVERPLRQAKDYSRFSGKRVRIHVYRPLTAAELGNASYFEKNSKQKNFLGTLLGVQGSGVQLLIPMGAKKQDETISIPFALISKAHLDPEFDFSELTQSKKEPKPS